MTATLAPFDVCKLEGHVENQYANPRLQHLCGRCGRLRVGQTRERDIEQEQEWVREAAEFAQYVHNPDDTAAALNSYRQRRAGSGPWRDLPREWIREAEEEAVDLANYVCAALQELDPERDDEDAAKCQMLLRMALAATVTAFAALGEYRRADL